MPFVDFHGDQLRNVGDAVEPSDAATKGYVDTHAAGLDVAISTPVVHQAIRWDGTKWVNGVPGITSLTAGAGLTGGTINTTGTVALATVPGVAGQYNFARITVDTYGRITAAGDGVGEPPAGNYHFNEENDNTFIDLREGRFQIFGKGMAPVLTLEGATGEGTMGPFHWRHDVEHDEEHEEVVSGILEVPWVHDGFVEIGRDAFVIAINAWGSQAQRVVLFGVYEDGHIEVLNHAIEAKMDGSVCLPKIETKTGVQANCYIDENGKLWRVG
jgi:hypothetical protein